MRTWTRMNRLLDWMALMFFLGIFLAREPMTAEAAYVQQAKLFPSDPQSPAYFGSGDSVGLGGNTAVVTNIFDTHDGKTQAGAAYVYGSGGGGANWTLEAKITASDAAAYEWFGQSVVLDPVTHNILWIAAPYSQGAANQSGSVYEFSRTPGTTTWIETGRFFPADGVQNDQFGRSMALDGNTMIVAAPSRNSRRGGAYAWVRDSASANWTQQATLFPDDTDVDPDTYLGSAVALSGDTAVLGPYRGPQIEGFVLVFGRTGVAWSQVEKIVPPNPKKDLNFGYRMALLGSTMVVSSVGLSTYIPGTPLTVGRSLVHVFYKEPGLPWTETQQLIAPTLIKALNSYGASLSLSNGTLYVSDPGEYLRARPRQWYKGYVTSYRSTDEGRTWSVVDTVVAADTKGGVANGDLFGSALAVDGDRLAVGAFHADDPSGVKDSGAVYIFQKV